MNTPLPNTFVTERDGKISYRLYDTEIALHDPRTGTWVLDSGGWRTALTRDRLNELTPFRISSVRKEWRVSMPGDSLSVPFHDGIVLPDALMRGNS